MKYDGYKSQRKRGKTNTHIYINKKIQWAERPALPLVIRNNNLQNYHHHHLPLKINKTDMKNNDQLYNAWLASVGDTVNV
jgi:hypothetical protein